MPVEPSLDTVTLWATTDFGLRRGYAWQRHIVLPAVTARVALLSDLDRDTADA
jgi:hypothetical protein